MSMIAYPKILGIVIAAFVAGAFVASPELRAYAANTIGSADIINNSIQSIDIKDAEVKTADLAGGAVTTGKLANNAVTSAKIKDGEVKTSDLANGSVDSVKILDSTVDTNDIFPGAIQAHHIGTDQIYTHHIVDGQIRGFDVDPKFMQLGILFDGQLGWNPDGVKTSFSISEPRTTVTSVIIVNLKFSDAVCAAEHPINGAFSVVCTKAPTNGAWLHYLVINMIQ
jgi:hypothetical protein